MMQVVYHVIKVLGQGFEFKIADEFGVLESSVRGVSVRALCVHDKHYHDQTSNENKARENTHDNHNPNYQ